MNKANTTDSKEAKGWVNPYDSLTPEELILEAVFSDNEVVEPPKPEPDNLLLPGNFCFRARIQGVPFCEENGTRIDFCASLLDNHHEALWTAIEKGNPVQGTLNRFFSVVEDEEDGYWDMECLPVGAGSLQEQFYKEFVRWHPLYGFETGILVSDTIAICGEALAEHLTECLTPASRPLTYNQFRHKLVQMGFYFAELDTNDYTSFCDAPFEKAYQKYVHMFKYNMNMVMGTIQKMKAEKDWRIPYYGSDEEVAKKVTFPRLQSKVIGMRAVWEMGALVYDAKHRPWKETEKLISEVPEAAELAKKLDDLYIDSRESRTYERGRKLERYVYDIGCLADALSIELADIWAELKRNGEAEKNAASEKNAAEKNTMEGEEYSREEYSREEHNGRRKQQ